MNRIAASRMLQHPVAKPLVFVAATIPFALLLGSAITSNLGANPAEALIRATGDWTLRFLCLTLALTPLRHLTGIAQVLRYRRMIGLFAFFYGLLHVVCYAGFDMAFDVSDIVRDIVKRPFILAGTVAMLLMVSLALTSFNRAIRALGAARWQRLHRAVYVIASAGVLHFWWMRAGKNDFSEPAVYLAIVALLLSWRLVRRMRSVIARTRTASPPLVPDLTSSPRR